MDHFLLPHPTPSTPNSNKLKLKEKSKVQIITTPRGKFSLIIFPFPMNEELSAHVCVGPSPSPTYENRPHRRIKLIHSPSIPPYTTSHPPLLSCHFFSIIKQILFSLLAPSSAGTNGVAGDSSDQPSTDIRRELAISAADLNSGVQGLPFSPDHLHPARVRPTSAVV